ncbi:hypothetical protein CRYUN_Cryun06bG0037200 [Craigia yunnanensis]
MGHPFCIKFTCFFIYICSVDNEFAHCSVCLQIENEYEPESKSFGPAGQAYVKWAANMAVGLDTGVPWVMCKEYDAPDPVVFGLWWPNYRRPVEDLAFAVTRFIQKGGSFVNYYMYHGGTNFGRTAGGPFITTSYDYDAPIDEYGLIRQPKHDHLKELHKAIRLCEKALFTAYPNVIALGNYEQAHVFSSKSGGCAAFLSNYNMRSDARVTFNNMHYDLPRWSISILPDCQNVVYNTAKVGIKASQVQMLPTNVKLDSWETFNEDAYSVEDESPMTVKGLLEQLNITRDTSDYLWYTTSVQISSAESFLHRGKLPTLSVQSAGHGMHVFINGQLSGSAFGTRQNRRFTFTENINLHPGTNKISILSIAVGLPNIGLHFETWDTGVLGPVVLHGLDEGQRDLTWQKWSYKVGLKGEANSLGSPNSILSIDWIQGSLAAQKQHPLTWYKAFFDAPQGDDPLALDMGSMGKGQVWINGQSIGRYWTTSANGNCSECSYVGSFRQTKCQFGCGNPTQQWYHVPRSWLKSTQNLLVAFEETWGDASKISLVKRLVIKN